MWDIVIVGGGPAGLSAAINARQRDRSALVLAGPSKKGWLHRAERIDNYPGLYGVTGAKLLETLHSQAQDMRADFREGLVRQIMPAGSSFSLALDDDLIEARRVILATGANQPALLPGEEKLLGRGVSYCATCDGMLYRGKRVGVLGASANAAEEAGFLAGLCEEVLFFGKDSPQLDSRVKRMKGKVAAVLGEDRVTGVAVGKEEHPLDGLFILRDAMALAALLPGLDHDGPFIRVDRQMRTSISGVFAAGDCTGTPLQIAKAVGEGCVAALTAAEK
ncbi:MAG: FAD-dependent oxidoreductase [Clostridia bacterium]|nr:FAD-dependent oxidoreductase [Clostridia bacterium]